MKFLFLIVIMVASTEAGKLPNMTQNVIPNFATPYIAYGDDALPYAAPFIVSIRKSLETAHYCAGSIIDKEWIVTAAHCISDPINWKIIAGLYEISNFENNTQIRVVDWAKKHEYFSTYGPGPYDIAVLHVSKPFTYNQNVKSVSLPDADEIPTGEAYLYGWGKTSYNAVSIANILQTVETDVKDFRTCEAAMPITTNFHETNICSISAGYYYNGAACNGDSGGPLVSEYENSPTVLIGIVSWGFVPCGLYRWPSVYTRVSAFIDWIEEAKNEYMDYLNID